MEEESTDILENPHYLEALRNRIAVFDSADLIATAAGLQLLPKNAERTLRLEAFTHACATLLFVPGLPKDQHPTTSPASASDPGLASLAHGEDPYPGPFIEEIAFYGGGYAVFSGLTTGSTFVLRVLCNCLFQGTHSYMPIARQLRHLIHGTLTLSNTVIKRAGLDRTIDPVSGPGEPIKIPDSVQLLTLKTAVTFAAADLELFYGVPQDGSARWAPLTCSSGSFNLSSHGVDSGPLLLTPIVQSGAAYIVSCPEALLSALNHHIVRIIIEAGAGAWLADSYLRVVTSTVKNSFCIWTACLRNGILPLPLLFRGQKNFYLVAIATS